MNGIKSILIGYLLVVLFSYSAFGQKKEAEAANLDTAAIENIVQQIFGNLDSYDPLIQQHFSFDIQNKVFAVVNVVENSIDIINIHGEDTLSLKKEKKSILVDKTEGRHDLAMVYKPQGVAIYDNHIVYLASNRDSCFLSVLTLDGEQIVKKPYRGNASAFSYSKERTELYIAGEYDLGYNIIVINTKNGIENADYDSAPVFNYKKPKKAETIQKHDPIGIGLTVIAMGVVFITLLMLSVIFMMYGKSLVRWQNYRTIKHLKEKKKGEQNYTVKRIEEISGEEYAAISAAIHLYNDTLHDEENTVLTIQKQKRHYSPWSSKFQGLNTYFNNKK